MVGFISTASDSLSWNTLRGRYKLAKLLLLIPFLPFDNIHILWVLALDFPHYSEVIFLIITTEDYKVCKLLLRISRIITTEDY